MSLQQCVYLPLGNEEDGLELKLTFDGEVLDRKMVFPLVGQTLVERALFFGSDVGGIAGPDGLGLVELLVLDRLLLDLLRLLLLVLVLVNFLDLGLVFRVLGGLLLVLNLLS